MGKKKVIKKTEEELLKETEAVETKIQKSALATTDKKGISYAWLYVFSSYNNTTLTLTDEEGNVLAWSSAGKIGFKGTKKGTPYAANRVAETIAQSIHNLKIGKVKIKIKGIGGGRESAVRALAAKKVNIISIEDVTPVPHNGCRPRKPRRV
jgi:small subunit ribosomal protein S11